MRTEGQVRQKLKQVVYRHLQKLVRLGLKKKPTSCVWNKLVPVADTLTQVGVCGCTDAGSPVGIVCDSRIEELDISKSCPWWKANTTREAIRMEFKALLEAKDRGKLAFEYPDIVALLWVLDTPDVPELPLETEGGSDE